MDEWRRECGGGRVEALVSVARAVREGRGLVNGGHLSLAHARATDTSPCDNVPTRFVDLMPRLKCVAA